MINASILNSYQKFIAKRKVHFLACRNATKRCKVENLTKERAILREYQSGIAPAQQEKELRSCCNSSSSTSSSSSRKERWSGGARHAFSNSLQSTGAAAAVAAAADQG